MHSCQWPSFSSSSFGRDSFLLSVCSHSKPQGRRMASLNCTSRATQLSSPRVPIHFGQMCCDVERGRPLSTFQFPSSGQEPTTTSVTWGCAGALHFQVNAAKNFLLWGRLGRLLGGKSLQKLVRGPQICHIQKAMFESMELIDISSIDSNIAFWMWQSCTSNCMVKKSWCMYRSWYGQSFISWIKTNILYFITFLIFLILVRFGFWILMFILRKLQGSVEAYPVERSKSQSKQLKFRESECKTNNTNQIHHMQLPSVLTNFSTLSSWPLGHSRPASAIWRRASHILEW